MISNNQVFFEFQERKKEHTYKRTKE